MDITPIIKYIFLGLAPLIVFGLVWDYTHSWQGTVTEIVQFIGWSILNTRHGTPEWRYNFTIHLLADNGKKRTIWCPKWDYYRRYADLKVGDRLVKHSMEWYPVVVSATAGSLRSDKERKHTRRAI